MDYLSVKNFTGLYHLEGDMMFKSYKESWKKNVFKPSHILYSQSIFVTTVTKEERLEASLIQTAWPVDSIAKISKFDMI